MARNAYLGMLTQTFDLEGQVDSLYRTGPPLMKVSGGGLHWNHCVHWASFPMITLSAHEYIDCYADFCETWHKWSTQYAGVHAQFSS